MKRPIALVGLMGVGKSTVGMRLAERLCAPFHDLDDIIAASAGKTIPQIFERDGEPGFRSLELRVFTELTNQIGSACAVCATGGGIVVTPECRGILRTHWMTIYLSAKLETIVARLANETAGRPLLAGRNASLHARLEGLYERREAWYKEVAEMEIEVDGRSVDSIVDTILSRITDS